MTIVECGGIFRIYSSGTKTRQKAQKCPNGDYSVSVNKIEQDPPEVVATIKSLSKFFGKKKLRYFVGEHFF